MAASLYVSRGAAGFSQSLRGWRVYRLPSGGGIGI